MQPTAPRRYVYDEAGKVIEAHKQAGELRKP
jgi:YD repeat-containing protein